MFTLIKKGINTLITEGPTEFLRETTTYLRNKRKYNFPIVDKTYPYSIVLTPLVGFLCASLIIRRKTHYTRMNIFWTNIFGHRIYHLPTFEYYRQIGSERIENLSNRYFTHDDVHIKPTDTVFEVGAFVGVTTAMAANQAQRVIALEASPRNYNCAERNLDNNNVQLLNLAAWDEPGELEINYGEQANDDSLIQPDFGYAGQSVTVRSDTIENIAAEQGVETVDFLKVEAEGAEPEVIEGIGEMDIERVVVSCTEERDGESPREEVSEILRSKGYQIVEFNDKGFLFAKKN